MVVKDSDGAVEQHPAGRDDLVHEVEIPNVPGEDRVSAFQRVEVDRGVIHRGDLLARLKTAEPEEQPRQDARLEDNPCAEGVVDAMAGDVSDHPGKFAEVFLRVRMRGIEAAEIVRQLAQNDRQVHEGPGPQEKLRPGRQAARQGVDVDARIEQKRRSRRACVIHEIQVGVVPPRQRPSEPLRLDAA